MLTLLSVEEESKLLLKLWTFRLVLVEVELSTWPLPEELCETLTWVELPSGEVTVCCVEPFWGTGTSWPLTVTLVDAWPLPELLTEAETCEDELEWAMLLELRAPEFAGSDELETECVICNADE